MESLPRIDFVELHDLDGTPAALRTLHTESIAFRCRSSDRRPVRGVGRAGAFDPAAAAR
ncbi:hypothetical protein SK803_23070 [Lentzea sp. BCCO 10_0856]|uniref:Uncharacterized protein n=1 Tax=Lentzea miocenica TaxID=3095431 RepID=A0ABU4T4L6_9PSEU|nr:hypothetical protein [Lentzea sp. BCCO 10_0856]MDX8033110.1 hypothetical protein [Lentzea sp. BCCO 10_0856]